MKTTRRESVPLRLKRFAWLNIALQSTFLLAATLNPRVAGADGEQHLLAGGADKTVQTKVCALSAGETSARVAKKYNMASEALRKCHRPPTFAQGFDNLHPGDRLDVPADPLPEGAWDEEGPDATKVTEDALVHRISGMASQAGAFLSNHPDADAASSMVRGMATAGAGDKIRQWLSRFGSASVQLDADRHLSLKNSQLDLLVPLHEQKDTLVFTQGSLHRTDERAQANLGYGLRYSSPGYMFGGNLFTDYDLARGHARSGVGIEYWRNFLKLAANGYLRLTTWKDSPDLNHYEARPANGWDIRAQGWLPALPQLGGKLTWAQYYGREIALFGEHNRRRNPRYMTAGVNFTPVPLLTVSAELRQEQSGKTHRRLGIELSYQPGVPWLQQISPDAVAAQRSLAGSRYDRVDRNNNMVLEYRKKEVIRLRTAELVTGYAGDKKSLGVSVNSHYGLERIDWSALSLVAAGGRIVQNATDYSVVLPDWQSGAQGINSYTISGVAVDKKGNVSAAAYTQVTVAQAAIDMSMSSLTPRDFTLPADGKTQQQLVLKVMDYQGKPLDIAEAEISVRKASKPRGTGNAILSSFTRRGAGEYIATLTAGTSPESFTLTPFARNVRLAPANVSLIFLPDRNSTRLSKNTLTILPENAIANGKMAKTIRLQVNDVRNNPLPGAVVSFSADNGASLAVPSVKTDAKGLATTTLTSTVAGVIRVTASVNSNTITKETTFIDTAQAGIKTATVDLKSASSSITVGDDNRVMLTATVVDAHNNPVKDASVVWQTDRNQLDTAGSVTNERGEAVAHLSGTLAGLTTVTAGLFNGANGTAKVTFSPGQPVKEHSQLTVTPGAITADGSSATMATLTLRDRWDNPVAGQQVDWSTDQDKSSIRFTTFEKGNGIYQARLSGKTAASMVITARVRGIAIKQQVNLVLTADNHSAVVEGHIGVTSGSAVVGQQVTYTVVLTDKNGNALGAGVPVTWSANEGSTLSKPVTMTDGTGSTAVTVTRIRAGTAKLNLLLPSGTTAAPEVVFNAGIPDESRSGLTLSPSVIVAGKGSATLALVLRDRYGNPISGHLVSGKSSHDIINISTGQEDGLKPGHYIMAVNANTSGTAALSVKVNDTPFKQTKMLIVKGDTESGKVTQVRLDKTRIIAGDRQGVTYSAVVTDMAGNKLSGVMVSWHLTGEAESFATTSRTDDNGIAATTVKSYKSGQLKMVAYLDEHGPVQAETVTVVAGDVDTFKSSFKGDRTLIGSDGAEAVNFIVRLVDRYGNAIEKKEVSIQGAAALPGFTLTSVNDGGDGNYTARGTSTAKGRVTLRAQVDNKTIDGDIKITVGAVTPDLRFAHARQTVIWSKTFAGSQSVKGMPAGVQQAWSSSDETVARVENGGKVTLLKSGAVRITVQIPGNGQYGAAQASYELIVKKADPKLVAGHGKPIKSTWADGKTYSIAATFGNHDVGNDLIPEYFSNNSRVVTVDRNGTLKAIRPGTTMVRVSTPESARFIASSVDLPFVLDKGTIDVSFDVTEIKKTDQQAFTLQSPNRPLPDDASVSWASSDNHVVNVSGLGRVQGKVAKGRARLTLRINANDYYHANSGFYDVMIYTRPMIDLGKIHYISKGIVASSGIWSPVFTDDTISVSWSADTASEFSKAESVTVYLKDRNGAILFEKREQSPAGSKTTTMKPHILFWGKKLHVELVAKGYGTLTHSVISNEIKVRNLTPDRIWTTFTVRSHVETVTGEGVDDACRESAFGRDHWNNVVVNGGKIGFGGKKLLFPMLIGAQIKASQNGHDRPGHFPKNQRAINSDQHIAFGTVQIANSCWKNHVGGYRIGVKVNYFGKNYDYWAVKSHGWGGNGDGMYVERVDSLHLSD